MLDSDPVFVKFQNNELVHYNKYKTENQDHMTLSLFNFHITGEFKMLSE